MAGRAIHRRLALAVTVETSVHARRDLFLKYVVRLHGSMTLAALKSGTDMRRMTKEDKVRNTIHRHPSDALSLLLGSAELGHFGTVRLNDSVAGQTQINAAGG